MSRKSMTTRGVAAIEFALLLVLLVMLLTGLFVYSILLQIQQSVTRATGDGARLLQHLSQKEFDQANLDQAVAMAVKRGIKDAGLADSVDIKVEINWSVAGQATLIVIYPNPILNRSWDWLPVLENLKSQAVVKL